MITTFDILEDDAHVYILDLLHFMPPALFFSFVHGGVDHVSVDRMLLVVLLPRLSYLLLDVFCWVEGGHVIYILPRELVGYILEDYFSNLLLNELQTFYL